MMQRILYLAYLALLRSLLIRSLLSAPLLAVSLQISPALAVPPPDTGPSVLILQSLDAQASPYTITTGVFRQRFQAYYDVPVSFAEISLDAWWGGTKDREPYQIELIRSRIADRAPDLVVNMGPAAIDFWLRNRGSIPDDIPTLMVSRQSYLDPGVLEPGDAAVVSSFAFSNEVDDLLQMLPQTRRVVIVFGASELERNLTAEARKELARFGDRIEFIFTSDLSMPEVEALVQGLPEHSAVLYCIFSIDAQGLILPLHAGLESVVAASSAPVFGAFDHQLGHGIVGGTLIPTQGMAGAMAIEARKLLEQPATAPFVHVVPQGTATYDARALRKWQIGVRSLPRDSRVLFEEEAAWSRYGHWVLLTVAVVSAQMLTIALLLLHRRRRNAAELAGARLSSRLISAHEDERARLARELHDDLSQRLAGLSIDAAFLTSPTAKTDRAETLRKMQTELARLGKDVHDLSYQLHPSIVGELGLVTALRTEVERVRRQTQVRIESLVEDVEICLSRDAALCLYRIAQEALHNALRHAGATAISVALRRDKGSLVLEIRDNGKGFDVREASASGIGVSGMHERARLAGGRLQVSSQPGRGTAIIVNVASGRSRDEQDQSTARR
jgi:signal transduction histidine kinase